MTERERFEEWYGGEHEHSSGLADLLKQARLEAWQARAEIAQERERVLVEALEGIRQFSSAVIDLEGHDVINRKAKQALSQWEKKND